jgi:LysM repeat protein
MEVNMKQIKWFAYVTVFVLATFVLAPAPLHADGPNSTAMYVVRFGDSLSGIAKTFGTTPQAIAARNGIKNFDRIYVGQRLVITTASSTRAPALPSSNYIVQRGDTLSAIAYTQRTSVAALVAANGLINANAIYIGQRLIIPRARLISQSPLASGYTVQSGETLTAIAAKFGVSPYAILIANNLRNASMIFTGQVLIIPAPNMQPASNEPTTTPTEMPTTTPTTNLQPAVCNPIVSISSPLMNETLSAINVPIVGTANLPTGFDPASSGFQFYKVEFGEGEKPILFFVIGNLHFSPAGRGTLETWDTAGLPNGTYILRLTAVDSLGQYPSPCEVRVTIQR